MYNKNNLAVFKMASKSTIKPEMATVAFYGDRTIATDSFKLIEMSAKGEKHEPVLYPAELLAGVKLKKGETITDVPVKPFEGGSYPNVDMVINTHFSKMEGEEYATVKLNGEYLEEILKILKQVDGTFKAVTLSVPTQNQFLPVLLTAECRQSGREQKARALIMPFNK